VATYRGQAAELIFHRDEMLEGAERNRRQAKRAPEIKVPHVSAVQADSAPQLWWLGPQPAPASLEHALR